MCILSAHQANIQHLGPVAKRIETLRLAAVVSFVVQNKSRKIKP